MAVELITLVTLALLALVAGLILQRRRRSHDHNDELNRACHGDEEQAERLEMLERERTTEELSRAEARRRAAERLKRDRI